MKSLLTILLILATLFSADAQHQHFLYLQTDNKQPFFVRVNEQVYSSSTSGYVVIPKLVKGDYNLSVGFPKNEFPQQSIAIKINGDGGYLLKNFPDKGWGLYNIHTMEVIMAGAQKANTPVTSSTRTDAFSNVLADVVNTPSLKEEQAKVKDPEVKAPAPQPEPARIQEQVTTANTIQPSIIKLSSTKDEQGSYAVYLDPSSGDTIKVFIGNMQETVVVKKEEPVAKPDMTTKTEDKTGVEQKEVKTAEPEDKRFLNIEIPPVKNKDTAAVIVETKIPEVKAGIPSQTNKGLLINSDCKALAGENDFMKARKKMAAEDNPEDMISAARKLFKSKCFSTEQVKNLAVLFLNDEGKYKFFDAAYPFVHDTQNFSQLQSELKDEYYISRFRAMVRK